MTELDIQALYPKPWPQKWVTCRKCTADWLCSGYPAGPQTKFTDAFESGCYQLIDKNGVIWLFPRICQSCADRREARPLRPKKAVVPPKVRSPHND